MNKKYYFSCHELCLVLMVFLMLSAVMIPVLGNAQAGAKKASCLDNLRTCIKATIAYADENQGVAILKYGDSSSGKLLLTMAFGKAVTHSGKIARRLTVENVICPDTTVLPARVTWHFSEFYAVPYGVYNKDHSLTPYEIPEGFYAIRKWPNADVAVNFKKIRYADSAVIYAEAWNAKKGVAISHYGLTEKESGKLDFRHNEQNNMAFADGHVEGKPLSFITEQREASGISRRWYVYNGKRESVAL